MKKLFTLAAIALASISLNAADATFTMSTIFTGSNQSAVVTTPVNATVSTTASASNAKTGKLGSDNQYFQILLDSETFTGVSITGCINTTNTSKTWGFQFSTDGGKTWGAEQTQANDGNKTAHEIAVTATVPSGANGFRVIRKAGTSTTVSSITLTLAGGTTPPATVDVTSVTLNKTATTIQVGSTETLTATVAPSNATNQNLSWESDKSNIASVDAHGKITAIAVGTANITVSSTDGSNKSATCVVTVVSGSTPPPATVDVTSVTLNKTSTSLTVGASEQLTATVAPSNATNQTLSWQSDKTSVATVDNTGKITAVAAGTANITATSTDGTNKSASCAVTVTAATVVIPSTDLTIHVPEVYEARSIAGGYGGTLTVKDGREYEVYYAGKDAENNMTVDIRPSQKLPGIAIDKSATSCKAPDGWFEAATTSISNFTNTVIDEFAAGTGTVHKMQGCSYKMHIKGYDQFSILAADKNIDKGKDGVSFKKNQRFQVFIDDEMQPETQCSTSNTVRRYDVTTGEHVIEVKALGDGTSLFYGFSLRIAQEPRTRWVKGNDSTQSVLQTTAPKAVYYYTKYNSKGETKLEWDGATATGIALTNKTSDGIGDTLVLGGVANCPVGTYNYRVVSYMNGQETSSTSGSLRVTSEIKALGDTIISPAYQDEALDEIRFRYYALSSGDVTVEWPNGQPTGVSCSGSNGVFTIGGTPTVTGEFPFVVTVLGGNSISGKITIETFDMGNDPVLFLFKNNGSTEKDGVYKYLKGKGRNLIARKAKTDGLRAVDQYAKYKWILISEDVDANNEEVLAAARGEVNLPVLNMKSFSYSPDRLGWGAPNNGSLTQDGGRFITVQRNDHPIFQALNKKQGDRIQVLDTVITRGLMPAAVDYEGTLCLATALTRDINNYYGDGVAETFLHEIPAALRPNGKKYICLPIGMASSNGLTADGKKLIDEVVKYLLSNQTGVDVPELKINTFTVNGQAATIDQFNSTIEMTFDVVKNPSIDLSKLAPVVTIASGYTFVTPGSGETVDFSKSAFSPVEYVVSDYINRRIYNVTIRTNAGEGIENVYAVGEWVNIYDIYGRKLTTTNENIYTMDLPRGMYLVVTESGETVKLLK